MTTNLWRVNFNTTVTTEAQAREAVEGINGGNVSDIKTMDNAAIVAWFRADVDAADAVAAELVADDRVADFDRS